MVIMRELTGGLYFGASAAQRKWTACMTATDTLTYNENEIRRIAIKRALTSPGSEVRRSCSVDKANVLDSSRLWRKVVEEVAKEYPDVELSHMLVDNCAMQLVKDSGSVRRDPDREYVRRYPFR